MIVLLLLVCAQLAAGSQAWDVLDKSLADGSAEHRRQALAALSTMSDPGPDAVKRVEAALQDKDVFVRQSAALALGAMKATAAIPALKQALDDDSPEVDFAAAKSLTEMGDASGRDLLIAVLAGERKDTPGMMTNALRKAKGKIHHPEGLMLMGVQDATGAMFGPVSMVIPAILDTADLKSKGAPGRAAATAYLAKDPDPYAITLLEWALTDDNQFVRLEAAKGLGDRGNAESVPKLEAMLGDSHNIVRDMASVAMIRIAARNGEAGHVTPGPVVTSEPVKK